MNSLASRFVTLTSLVLHCFFYPIAQADVPAAILNALTDGCPEFAKLRPSRSDLEKVRLHLAMLLAKKIQRPLSQTQLATRFAKLAAEADLTREQAKDFYKTLQKIDALEKELGDPRYIDLAQAYEDSLIIIADAGPELAEVNYLGPFNRQMGALSASLQFKIRTLGSLYSQVSKLGVLGQQMQRIERAISQGPSQREAARTSRRRDLAVRRFLTDESPASQPKEWERKLRLSYDNLANEAGLSKEQAKDFPRTLQKIEDLEDSLGEQRLIDLAQGYNDSLKIIEDVGPDLAAVNYLGPFNREMASLAPAVQDKIRSLGTLYSTVEELGVDGREMQKIQRKLAIIKNLTRVHRN